MASTKGFNQVYAEAMELSNNSEALMDNLTKAAMAAGRLTAETKRDLEVFKQLRATTKDISTQLAEAGKRNLTSEAVALQQINDKILAQQKRLQKALEDRLKIEKDDKLTATEKVVELARANKEYEKQLEQLKMIEAQESYNVQRTKDRLRKLSKEMDNLNSRASGTIFDPTVGLFHSTGAEIKDIDKTMDYVEKKSGELGSTIADLFSGSMDNVQSRLDSLVKGGGNFLRDLNSAGKAAREGNRRKAEAGESVSLFNKALSLFGGKLGGFLGGFGKLLGMAGGLVAGVFAVVKGIQAVEEAVKGVNKELVDAYGATDLMASGSDSANKSVNEMRKALSDSSWANSIGETLEGARGLVTSLNEMGINARTMDGDFEAIKETVTVLKAGAVSLGVDFGTVASFTQQFKEELGMATKDGQLLDKMGDSFARIRDVAMQSGFSTNRFFQVIQSLSDGIGDMNIRIGETSRMFLSMSKVLGPRAAQAFTQGLMGGFKGEGIQERFKRLILMGGSKKIMQRTASRTINELQKNLSTQQAGILREVGVDTSDLSKVSDAQLEKAMSELRRRGGEGGRARGEELMRAVRLARGGAGGLSDQAMALGELDLTGTLSAQMKQLYNIQGDKGFQGITAIGMEKLVQMTGKSLDELEQLRRLDMANRADFARLTEITEMQDSEGNRLTPEAMNAVLKENGFGDDFFAKTIDGVTKIVDRNGNIVEDVQGVIEARSAEIDNLGGKSIDQLSLLQEVVDATMTSADMINNYLGGILQQNGDYLSAVADWAIQKMKDPDRVKRMEEAERLRAGMRSKAEDLTEEKTKERRLASEKAKEISEIKDPRKKAQAVKEEKERRERAEREIRKKELDLKLDRNQARILASGAKLHGTDPTGRSKAIAQMAQSKEGQRELERNLSATEVLKAQLASEGFDLGHLTNRQFKTKEEHDRFRALEQRMGLKTLESIHRPSGDKSYEEGGEQRSVRVIRTRTGKVITTQSARHKSSEEAYAQKAIEGFGDAFDTNNGPVSILGQDVARHEKAARASKEHQAAKSDYEISHFLAEQQRDLETRKKGEATLIAQAVREGDKEAEAEHRARLDELISETPNKEDLEKIYEDERKAKEKWETSKKMIDTQAESVTKGYKKYNEMQQQAMVSSLGLDAGLVESKEGRKQIRDALKSRFERETDPFEKERLKRKIDNFNDVYVDDGRFSNSGRPMAIREGSNSRMIGSPNDEIFFLDPSKGGGRGGGGMGGNVYNIIVPKGPAESQSAAIANGFRTAGHA